MSESILQAGSASHVSDHISIKLWVRGDSVVKSQLECRGCPDFLRKATHLRSQLNTSLKELESYSAELGDTHVDLILCETLEKLLSLWPDDYPEQKIVCPCFMVRGNQVDQAILDGRHSLVAIKQSLFCGQKCDRCHEAIQEMLNVRLKN